MEPRRPPTFLLTERVAAECRLTPADVDFLQKHHRTHLRLAPTGRRDCYRVTPAGHVGTIIAPDCRLVVRPKIPLTNLFHLLDPTAPLPAADDHTTATAGNELLDVLAARLARLLDERAAAGLHRAYAERCAEGPFLQGRLDVPGQLRGGLHKDRFHCRHDDFTADVPCNQLPKATADLLLRCPLLGEAVRGRLRQALTPFAEISPTALHLDAFAAAAAHRLTESYRPLLDLCRLLAEGLTPGREAGRVPCPAFLLDMERVFETYVTRGLEQACTGAGGYAVRVQPRFVANQPGGRPDIDMQPDLTLERDGRPVLVLDAKWKHRKGTPWLTDDLYQVMAYGLALGAARVVLVYAGGRDRARRYTLARAPLRVEIRTLRVVGPRPECERSLERLARAVLTRAAARRVD